MGTIGFVVKLLIWCGPEGLLWLGVGALAATGLTCAAAGFLIGRMTARA